MPFVEVKSIKGVAMNLQQERGLWLMNSMMETGVKVVQF
jgi:hypothetical protein